MFFAAADVNAFNHLAGVYQHVLYQHEQRPTDFQIFPVFMNKARTAC